MGKDRDALAAGGPVIDPKHPMDVARELIEVHWTSDTGRLIQVWRQPFHFFGADAMLGGYRTLQLRQWGIDQIVAGSVQVS